MGVKDPKKVFVKKLNKMHQLYIAIAISTILFGTSACIGIGTGEPFDKIPSGKWHCTFVFDNATDKVPVIIEVTGTNKKEEQTKIFIVSGDNRLEPDRIAFVEDTLFCYFDQDQTCLKLNYRYKMEVSHMKGKFMDQRSNASFIPIMTEVLYRSVDRFPDYHPIGDIQPEGEWDITVTSDKGKSAEGKLSIERKGKLLKSTIRLQSDLVSFDTHLEGIAQKDQIYMSGFNGKYVIGLEATVYGETVIDKGTLRLNRRKYYLTAKRPTAGVGE